MLSSADEVKPTLEHLFRHESAKLISVLTKVFGTHNLELAEDVVQDTLLKAMEQWKFHGIPKDPSAWLFQVARNKALDVIRRDRYKKEFAADVSPLLKSEYTVNATLHQLVNANDIEDEQLRMMFVCCHPDLPEESQIALILKTLCGFSVSEIARAFVTNDETIAKRIYRARQMLREKRIAFQLPAPSELQVRLSSVQVAIYLIFNEGYHSTSHDTLIREDLIEESLRLAKMLVDHPLTGTEEVRALLALFCFLAARLYGRVDDDGNLLPLRNQDRSKWNQDLIRQGRFYLQQAATGPFSTRYHAEAAIAYEHCVAPSYEQTRWDRIVQVYDWLLDQQPDPVIALNRLIAYAEVHGPERALEEIDNIQQKDLLANYYLYPATLGEWYLQMGNKTKAKDCFEKAMQLTQSIVEKRFLQQKVNLC